MDRCRHAAAGALPALRWHPCLGQFFHLNHNDQRRMFSIFADHGSGGTVLMFNTGPGHGEAVGEYKGDPLYHASLSSTEYEALTARFGFEVVQHATNDVEAGGRTVWFCRKQ